MSQLLSSGPILLLWLYSQNLETKDAQHDQPRYSVHAGHFLLWQLLCRSPLGWNRSIASAVKSRACELLIIRSQNSRTVKTRISTVIWWCSALANRLRRSGLVTTRMRPCWQDRWKWTCWRQLTMWSECIVFDRNRRSLCRRKKKEQGKLHKEPTSLHSKNSKMVGANWSISDCCSFVAIL